MARGIPIAFCPRLSGPVIGEDEAVIQDTTMSSLRMDEEMEAEHESVHDAGEQQQQQLQKQQEQRLPGEDGIDEDTPKGWRRDRVAVFFGYVGARFQGLQKNPGAFTVESELEIAIFKAGGISRRDFGDFHRVGWNRAARTDKGVHAAAQVISLKLQYPPDGLTGMVAAINSHLPADISVFDIVRVTQNFNAKNNCSGRQYEYLLPTATLAPFKFTMAVSRAPSMPYAMASAQAKRVMTVVDPASDRFCNGESAAAAAREEQARLAAAGAALPLPFSYTLSVLSDVLRVPYSQSNLGPAGGASAAVAPSSSSRTRDAATASGSLFDDFTLGLSAARAAAEEAARLAEFAANERRVNDAALEAEGWICPHGGGTLRELFSASGRSRLL